MSVKAQKLETPDQRLTLDFVLQAMLRTGLLEPKVAETIAKQVDPKSTDHPLVVISKYGVRDRRPPNLPLSLESMTQWLANLSGKPYVEIDPLKIDIKMVTAVLPAAYARRLQVIPVTVEADHIVMATSEPFALGWIEQVQDVTKKRIEVAVASPVALRYFLEEFFTVRTATQEFKRDQQRSGAEPEFGQVLELDRMLGRSKGNDLGKDAQAVVRIVDWLFQFAHAERATDIHLEPKAGKGQVRFRIDGRMRIVYNFEPELMLPVVSRIKILAEMQVDEKRRPQDGRIRYNLGSGREIEMRLSTIPVQHGEKLVTRIFDPKLAGTDFEELGFAPEDIKKWDGLINLPHGIVLVTGPTGSGKSTTLHTSMRKIACEDVNICTVEDPVEIVNDELNQMQVSAKSDVTFGNAIRAFLRQDPDIIMVGEIRDADAGRMAIQAALTGHLVLSTLHTNDAISSITRLVDLGIPGHLITASLRGMMAQRLVRRLCEFCKEKVATPAVSWKELVGAHGPHAPSQIFTPKGCRECKHTGYMGRLCVYEVVVMDEELREATRKGASLDELLAVAKGKFVPLRINGARKVASGNTSLEEVLRVIF